MSKGKEYAIWNREERPEKHVATIHVLTGQGAEGLGPNDTLVTILPPLGTCLKPRKIRFTATQAKPRKPFVELLFSDPIDAQLVQCILNEVIGGENYEDPSYFAEKVHPLARKIAEAFLTDEDQADIYPQGDGDGLYQLPLVEWLFNQAWDEAHHLRSRYPAYSTYLWTCKDANNEPAPRFIIQLDLLFHERGGPLYSPRFNRSEHPFFYHLYEHCGFIPDLLEIYAV